MVETHHWGFQCFPKYCSVMVLAHPLVLIREGRVLSDPGKPGVWAYEATNSIPTDEAERSIQDNVEMQVWLTMNQGDHTTSMKGC